MIMRFSKSENLKTDLSTGVDWCPNCQKFTCWELGRRVKSNSINLIPVMVSTEGQFHMCSACQCGTELSRADYLALRDLHKPFSKQKKQIACFQEAAEMAKTLPANALSADQIIGTLRKKYPICATPKLEAEYKRRLMQLLQIHGIQPDPAAMQMQNEIQNPPKKNNFTMDEI